MSKFAFYELSGMEFVCDIKDYSLYIQNNATFEDESDVYIGLFDMYTKRVVANVWLSYEKNGYYSVDMVEVSKLYKGESISFLLYKAILQKTNIKLVCGDRQSPGGQYIWRKLIKSKVVDVKASKMKKYPRKFDVKVSSNNVFAKNKDSIVNIYDDDYEDYRLFAEVV